MPVNPFQTVAEMSWGDYRTKKSGAVQSPQVSTSLAGQGHRGRGWSPGAPEAILEEPRASGRMPQGNANIGRPNYGSQQPQQPQRQGRRASFGGMGAGATKGGGGMTAGGDIKFDLGIGNTKIGDNFSGTVSGQIGGMGNKISDSMTGGTIDQSQRYAPETTGPKGGSSRGGAGAAGKGGAGGGKTGAGSGPGGAGGAGRGGAGGNAGRGGDAGEMTTDNSGVKFGSPVAQVGRNRIGSDNISRRSKSRTTKTDVRASGSATASADSKTDARKTSSTKDKKEKTTAKPTSTTATPTSTSATKEDPKTEATGKAKIKEKAAKAVSKATKALATKPTKKTTTKKKTEEEEE